MSDLPAPGQPGGGLPTPAGKRGGRRARQIVSIAEWYQRHSRPIETEIWSNLHRIAKSRRDVRAATRAAQVIAARLDPEPAAQPIAPDASRPINVNIAILKPAESKPGSVPNGDGLRIHTGNGHGQGQ